MENLNLLLFILLAPTVALAKAKLEWSKVFLLGDQLCFPAGTAGRAAGAAGFLPVANSPVMGKYNQVMVPFKLLLSGQKTVALSCSWGSGPWDIQNGGNHRMIE